MFGQLAEPTYLMEAEELEELEIRVQCHLGSRIHGFHLLSRAAGLILQGHASTYYAKQLAQHAVMNATELPILANEIQVV